MFSNKTYRIYLRNSTISLAPSVRFGAINRSVRFSVRSPHQANSGRWKAIWPDWFITKGHTWFHFSTQKGCPESKINESDPTSLDKNVDLVILHRLVRSMSRNSDFAHPPTLRKQLREGLWMILYCFFYVSWQNLSFGVMFFLKFNVLWWEKLRFQKFVRIGT